MITLYFASAEAAVERIMDIKDKLVKTRSDYEALLISIKNNIEVENKMTKMGLVPTHRTINVQSVSFGISIHLVPSYSWLFNKINNILSNINYIIEELDKAINYIQTNNIRSASIALFIDEVNKHTKLVIMP